MIDLSTILGTAEGFIALANFISKAGAFSRTGATIPTPSAARLDLEPDPNIEEARRTQAATSNPSPHPLSTRPHRLCLLSFQCHITSRTTMPMPTNTSANAAAYTTTTSSTSSEQGDGKVFSGQSSSICFLFPFFLSLN